MLRLLYIYQLTICLPLAWATVGKNEVKLPLCPRHLEYFPQSLPMHCRMPRNIDAGGYPSMPEFQTMSPEMQQYQYFRSQVDKQPSQMQVPIPQFPPMPPEMPPGMMPGMPQGMPGGMPMMPGMPPGMPVPVGMPAGPSHKLPVIVMPFYSPDVPRYPKHHGKHHHRKHPSKKRYRYNSTEIDSDEEGSSSSDNTDSSGSSEHGWWKGHKKKRNHNKYGISRRTGKHIHVNLKKKPDLLTPILQYVTNDGYVIFEKQISKNEAKTWLGPKDKNQEKEEEIIKKEAEFFENLEPKEYGEGDEEKDNREVNQPEKIKINRKVKLPKLRSGSLLKPGPQPN